MSDYNFVENVFSYVKNEGLIKANDRIVVGVSGGADSVALLLSLYELSDRLGLAEDGLIAVHVNHMIRGSEALSDRYFVEELCASLDVRCEVFSRDIPAYARELGLTVEEAGRSYRYDCFNEASVKYGCSRIAVAHNKNDLVETVIFNMARGSGLKGLSGIPAKRDNIIRPLLFADRKEIEEYLGARGQDYRTDSTNLTVEYDRNRIRHIIIPALQQINSSAAEHIIRLAEEAGRSYENIRKHAVAGRLPEVTADGNNREMKLDIDELKQTDRLELYYIIYEAITIVAGVKKDITRRNVEAVIGLVFQDTGKRVELPYNIIARHSYDKLIISTGIIGDGSYNILIDGEGEYIIPDNGILYVHIRDISDVGVLAKNDYTKVVDYDKIKGRLCVRNPQDGDYITINDKGNSKKISRVFIDNKIDREARKYWPVVAEGSEVIWAVGLRYNEAYRVDASTTKLMIMKYIRKGVIDG